MNKIMKSKLYQIFLILFLALTNCIPFSEYNPFRKTFDKDFISTIPEYKEEELLWHALKDNENRKTYLDEFFQTWEIHNKNIACCNDDGLQIYKAFYHHIDMPDSTLIDPQLYTSSHNSKYFILPNQIVVEKVNEINFPIYSDSIIHKTIKSDTLINIYPIKNLDQHKILYLDQKYNDILIRFLYSPNYNIAKKKESLLKPYIRVTSGRTESPNKWIIHSIPKLTRIKINKDNSKAVTSSLLGNFTYYMNEYIKKENTWVHTEKGIYVHGQ